MCLSYELANYKLVNLDANIFLAWITNVAWSNYHDLYQIDEKTFKTLFKFENRFKAQP